MKNKQKAWRLGAEVINQLRLSGGKSYPPARQIKPAAGFIGRQVRFGNDRFISNLFAQNDANLNRSMFG